MLGFSIKHDIPIGEGAWLTVVAPDDAEGVELLLEPTGHPAADGVDIRIIQLMLGHSSVQQTQRYLNVTDEELRRGLQVSWTRNRALRLVASSDNSLTKCHTSVTRDSKMWRARQDSNLWPSAPEADALSS